MGVDLAHFTNMATYLSVILEKTGLQLVSKVGQAGLVLWGPSWAWLSYVP